jgi:splicing factor 1
MHQQLMQELGGGSGPPARIEAGPGGYEGNGEGNGGDRPWQRGPTGGPAPWRTRRDNNDSNEGGAAPWARDRNRGYDNGGDSYQGQGQSQGYGGHSAGGAPPPWQQAPGTGYGGYGSYGGYGAAPGMGAPPGLPQAPGLAAPPGLNGINDLIQQYAGGAPPPPPPPPSGEAPPPPPGDLPPPPPPPGA